MLILEISPVRRGSKKSMVRLEGAESIALYNSEIRKLHLEEGEDLTDDRYDEIIREVLLPRAKKRALHLLEKQDRTRSNLISKLREGGYPSDIAEEAVSYAESFGYIDDRRYAANYIEYHQEDRSRLRIRRDLLTKGISGELIDALMDEYYSASETDQIMALLYKKNYDPKEADKKARDSIFRFLAGRGYSSLDICEALDIYSHKV